MFDAGGVLIRPVGGRWNPRYDFESIVAAHHPDVRPELFPGAIAEGQRVLDAGTSTVDRTIYHRAMLTVLGIPQPSDALLRELDAPAAGPVLELYPDARPALERIRDDGIGMSVVSDTWAGLEITFEELGIGHFFAGYAISEVLGCRKPDPRMYAEGSRLLGLEPAACLFIDDDPELVAAARKLGYRGVTLDRDRPADGPPKSGVVTTLDHLRWTP